MIGISECDRENGYKMENTLQDIIQENFPNQERQPIFKSRKYREHHKDVKGWRKIYQANGEQNKAEVPILVSDKIDFKPTKMKRDNGIT